MRSRHLLLIDLAGIAVAALAAFVLRFDLRFFRDRDEALVFLLAALVIKPAVFRLFGLYDRYWRYASLQDLKAVAVAAFGAMVLMGIFVGVALSAGALPRFSRAVLVIDGVLTLLAAGGIRLSIRVLGEARDAKAADRSGTRTKRVVVVGAGDAGTLVVREMQRNPQLGMEPRGFLDDDPAKQGKRICGVPVLGDIQALGRVGPFDEAVIAMPTAPGTAVRAVVEQCRTLGLKSQTIPGVFELLDGKVSARRLRAVEIADLLRRRQVTARADLVDYVKDRVVLVTGAGGSIGFELCRQVAQLGPARLVMLGHGENELFEAWNHVRDSHPRVPASLAIADIRGRQRLDHVLRQFTPEIVFHAAAYKHVPLMEENFEEAITNNVVGTMNVLDASLDRGVERFVSISTDKAVFPRGIMGASKRMADLLVKDAAQKSGRGFVAVRFGNVLGSRGSVVPLFQRQIERGGPVTVTHLDMKRFFMTISEAAHLVLQAGGLGAKGGLFVLDMGEPVRIVDLVKDLIHLSGLATDQIPIVVTGTRAGEKIEEALWEADAVVEPTAHPDILQVTERSTHTGDIRAAVAALELAARQSDRTSVNAILRDWIPTYVPPAADAAADIAAQVRPSESR